MTAPLSLSAKSRRTTDQPINYYMQQAIENPKLISLAAGLVDAESLPAADVATALREIAAQPEAARAALQYGTTQGLVGLRDCLRRHVAKLDGLTPEALGVGVDDVIVATGSQQILYLVSETMLDPGDIVIAEEPSYFVNHSVLSGHGARILTVPMDDDGMDTRALEELLQRLDAAGNIERVKLIYTCDYYQNPSGLTLSLERRRHLFELARRFSKRQRLLVLEDAAYRELGFEPRGLPSIKSFDGDNQYVVYAGAFSKPCAPGLKTGYVLLPRELVAPVLRFKGVHDFGSANLNQHIIERLMRSGAYDRHILELRKVYRAKCEATLSALDAEFGDWPEVRWTRPAGGMFVWLAMPEDVPTGPGSQLLTAALEEGMLYVPGEFCHVPDESGHLRRNEMRLSFGVEPPERIRDAIRRLRRAAERVRVRETTTV